MTTDNKRCQQGQSKVLGEGKGGFVGEGMVGALVARVPVEFSELRRT